MRIILSIIMTLMCGAIMLLPVSNDALARSTCPDTYVDFDGTQDADDDEFIYSTYDAYLEAKNNTNRNCNNGCRLTKGTVAECDNEFCDQWHILLNSDGNLVHKGNRVPPNTLFVCHLSGDDGGNGDHWHNMGVLLSCSDISKGSEYKKYEDTNIYRFGWFYYTFCLGSPEMERCLADALAIKWTGDTCECKNKDDTEYQWNGTKCAKQEQAQQSNKDCLNVNGIEGPLLNGEIKPINCSEMAEQHGEQCFAKCVDGTPYGAVTKCKDGYHTESQAKGFPSRYYVECEQDEQQPRSNQDPEPTMPPSTCKSQRTTPEGKACCDLPLSVATWNGQECICTDENKKFEIVNDHGKCVANITTNPTCADTRESIIGKLCCELEKDNIAQWSAEDKQCKCNDEGHNFEINNETGTPACVPHFKTCAEIRTTPEGRACCLLEDAKQAIWAAETQQCVCIVENMNFNLDGNTGIGYCVPKDRDAYDTKSNLDSKIAEINNISASLSQFNFNKSHWKNASGGFNTARLASDSVAGVVLGTAGGLITSSIIKKNQTKSGFENIQCTINGNYVASYGDDFVVGGQL